MQGREYNYRNLDYSQRHKMVHNEKKVLLKKKKQQTKCVIDCLEDKFDKFSQYSTKQRCEKMARNLKDPFRKSTYEGKNLQKKFKNL